MSRNSYDDQTKAAVMAALLEGQAISHVAKEYDIPEGTVKGWKSRAKKALGADEVTTQTKNEIGRLLVEYIHENLTTLREQARFFRDTEWLAKQDAAELATLHGVSTDKAVRLLEAMSPPNAPDTE